MIIAIICYALAYLLVGAGMLVVLVKTDVVPGMKEDEVAVGMCMIFWPVLLIGAIAIGILYLIGRAFILLGRAALWFCR